MVEQSDPQQILGDETYQLAKESFSAFAGEKTSIEDNDVKWALLLSLGIDQLSDDTKNNSLTFDKLIQILVKSVEDADPVEGICTDIADEYDSEVTGFCTYEQLKEFLSSNGWLGSSEEAMTAAMQPLITDHQKVDYRKLLFEIIK